VTPDGALVLIGFMGAGKTTAALQLGLERGLRVSDVDQLIEARAGSPIAEIFARDGEPRSARSRRRSSASSWPALAAATSSPSAAVPSPRLAYARRSPATSCSGSTSTTSSPGGASAAGAGRSRVTAKSSTAATASARRSTSSSPTRSSRRGCAPRSDASTTRSTNCARRRAGRGCCGRSAPRRVPGLGRPRAAGLGRLADRAAAVAALRHHRRARRAAVARCRGELDFSIVVPAGETSKSLQRAGAIWSELAQAGMTRGDHVVALGGGVVGDLAGFCAASYQRGVPVVQVPTTLAAQVDSAYGGKTAWTSPRARTMSVRSPAGRCARRSGDARHAACGGAERRVR